MPDAFDELQSTISQLKGLNDGTIDPETITLEDENIDPVDENPTDPTPEDPKPEDPKPDDQPPVDENQDDEVIEEDTKKIQTPEENRKFAEQRRQQELEKRVQEELNKRLQETPEVQAMRQLQELGFDPNTLIEQATLARLQEQSQQTGIPLEYLQQQHQQQQQTQTLQQQLAEMQTRLWETQIKADVAQVQQKYSALTEDDIGQAIDYMVNTLQRTDIPLEQAVMAVHGEKIMQSLKDQARNEVLAEKAGRKTPIAPQGGKTPSAPVLSDDEKYFAKIFGMTDEEYLKNKSNY